jgi:hypothetical protein
LGELCLPSKDQKDLLRYRKALTIAVDALERYGDPTFYHAIAIIGDAPTGGFDKDISRVDKSFGYDRKMPGAHARKAINLLRKRFGSLELEPIVDKD